MFAVETATDYGTLSRQDLEQLQAGARVDVVDVKRNPMDFVLWKMSKPDEPSWASPWGAGRPGWHIECSAMNGKELGEHFDIHGGGADLMFPHHENEIAQSEGAYGKPLARFWIHNGFVRVDNEKMSKSLGNFFTIREVLAKYDPETVRFFIVRVHYRTGLNYSDVHLDDARSSLKRLYTALDTVKPVDIDIDWTDSYAARFKVAMDEDFGTPEAVAVLFDLAAQVNITKSAQRSGLLKALGGILGLLQNEPVKFLQSGTVNAVDTTQIMLRIAERDDAKKAKNFALADAIRNDLLAQGIALKDSPSGTTWETV
jgi:cysteinyl-tRNA synthetase